MSMYRTRELQRRRRQERPLIPDNTENNGINYHQQQQQLHQKHYDDTQLSKAVIDLVVYIFFLILVTIVALNRSGESYYYLTKMVIDFIEEDFLMGNRVVSFPGLQTVSEFWKWFEVKFVQEFRYERGEMFIATENKLMGPPRMSQARVRNDSCILYETVAKHFDSCFSYFSYEFEDKHSFGFKNSSAWHYGDKQNEIFTVDGELGTYPCGKFCHTLMQDQTDEIVLLHELQHGRWIDRATRAVIIEFSIYNANLDMLCFAQFLVEYLPAGILVTRSNVQSIHLLNTRNGTDLVVLACECILLLLVLYYNCEELYEMYILRFKYCTKLWNLIDIFVVLIIYVATGISIHQEIFIHNKIEEHLNDVSQFIDFNGLLKEQKLLRNLIGICLFLSWFKSLKYLSFNKTMMQFSTTLSRCARDLFGFGLMFLIVFIAYAQFGYIAFGSELDDFHTFQASIFTLFRTILGDFDYLKIENANRVLGPVFFMTYIFFVFFVLLNMFLAIINDTYSDVKWEITQDVMPVGDYVCHKLKLVCRNLKRIFSRRARDGATPVAGVVDGDAVQIESEIENYKTTSTSSSAVSLQIQEPHHDNDVQLLKENVAVLQNKIHLIEMEMRNMLTRIDSFIQVLDNIKH